VFFPFDLFGSAGAGSGAELLADGLREILADNRRETVTTRAVAYNGKVRVRQFEFNALEDFEGWRLRGRQAVRRALRQGDFLLWVAGNHLGVLPVYDELSGADDVLVVQLDAHLDVHNFAACREELSHGNFLLHSDGPLPPLVNVGHRDLLLTSEYVGRFYRATYSAAEVASDPATVFGRLGEAARSAGRVFLDIDCDVFDPSVFPAVTQPVPFGLSPQLVLGVIEAVWSPNVAGVMLSEFDPGRDRNDACLATLAWLIEYVLLKKYEATPPDGIDRNQKSRRP
jgi:agmatinase